MVVTTTFWLSLIFILSKSRFIENGDEDVITIDCNNYPGSYEESNNRQEQAIAMDVCRTKVISGSPEYRMYRCNDTGYFDEVYTADDCSGIPQYIETLPADGRGEQCILNTTNICQYIMMKTPCDNDADYELIPVLANVCIDDGTEIFLDTSGNVITCAN